MPSSKRYRIGIDVGGTNTDCAILEFGQENEKNKGVAAWHKTRTTPNVTDGIATALKVTLTESGVDPSSIISLSIGTTHFINAVIECDSRRLAKVAVVRLGAPYTAQCPPFLDFPPRLRKIMEGHSALLDGGLQIDGKEIRPIDPEQIRRECDIIRDKGIKNIVLVGVFSPLASEGTQEHYARKLILDYLGSHINVVCSSQVGPIGLLERENAAILNCSILSFARQTVSGYYDVLARLDLHCKLYLTQLDGTLLAAPAAAEMPIRTFVNGPTNSMRGASFLANNIDKDGPKSSVIVVDIGGTTSDIGVLLPSGFPRKAAAYTEVGGVRTNFSMPDIYSIGLGGGSRVRVGANKVFIGPDSVGNNIEKEAIVFGGATLTVTDIAVASGLARDVGDASLIENQISQVEIASALDEVTRMLENAIDRMKTDPQDVTLLLVGGGSIIIPSKLRGVKEVIRPQFFSVANAVGAAIGRVSGEVDKVIVLAGKSYASELEVCKQEAIARAVESGADTATVTIAEVTAVQLPYVSNEATRIIVKAVGDLAIDAIRVQAVDSLPESHLTQDVEFSPDSAEDLQTAEETDPSEIDIQVYKPHITPDGKWAISETDLAWISEGCAILGCGGGGAPYPAYIMVRQILRKGGTVHVVDESYFNNPDAVVLPCGFMGSPSVSFERIPSGTEIPTASAMLMKYSGVEKVDAILSDEIGGKNGIEPMKLASSKHLNVPLLDGDLMGRAYPRMNQIVPCAYSKHGLTPAAGADGVGNCVIIPSTVNDAMVETLLRSACTDLGSALGVVVALMTISDFRKWGLSGSTSLAWRIGRAVALCRKRSAPHEIPRSMLEVQDGAVLFVGKIIDVEREVRGGFTWGKLTIAPLLQDEIEYPVTSQPATNYQGVKLVIPFQNENLSAELVGSNGVAKTLCSVPDLIAVLDSQSGSSIGTQDYRYGLRVTVIGMVGNPKWQTPEGLKLGGPEAFGMDIPYEPIGEYRRAESVIREFSL